MTNLLSRSWCQECLQRNGDVQFWISKQLDPPERPPKSFDLPCVNLPRNRVTSLIDGQRGYKVPFTTTAINQYLQPSSFVACLYRKPIL